MKGGTGEWVSQCTATSCPRTAAPLASLRHRQGEQPHEGHRQLQCVAGTCSRSLSLGSLLTVLLFNLENYLQNFKRFPSMI